MPLLFSPHPAPLLLSLPSTTKPHSRPRLRPVHASASPSRELLGKSALRRISEKLRSLGYLENSPESPAPAPSASDASGPSSPGEIFLPTPPQLPRHRVGSTLDPSWATGDGEADPAARRRRRRRSRRGRDEGAAGASVPPSAAELALPRDELRRLQGIGIRVRKRLKVGKAGVTEGIVNGIHERWRNAEVVKIRCEDVWALNMKRTHEILERKTGGLVIWRSGSTIILYRGANYKYPYFHYREKTDGFLEEESLEQSSSEDEDEAPGVEPGELSSCGEEDENHMQDDSSHKGSSDSPVMSSAEQRITGVKGKNQRGLREEDTSHTILSTKRLVFDRHEGDLDLRTTERNNMGAPNEQNARLQRNTRPSEVSTQTRPSLVAGVGSLNKFRLQLPGEVKLAEEADQLLNGLGPRFSDWWGYEPLPVDADMLPAVVPGFRRPFRLLPSGVPPKLTDREMTILRRLAHPLPFHYALGRSSNLQGLAVSMIKLWERCEVAKIAIKRDANNIDGVLISEELKGLTGGTLLSRDKESIVFYRGKDFLPQAVSLAIENRRKQSNSTKDKQKPNVEESTPHEYTSELKISSDVSAHMYEEKTSVIDSTAESLDTVAQNVENRLSQAIAEKEKAEKLLEELEKISQPSKAENREAISEEERYMLRKVGLKMKQFLLLGRRGVFDGTIENMHLHWKYRELVKIICKEHSIEDVEYAARTLEAESGGILVAVERVSKGHAIIVYRGKNYQRPSTLRPKTLLTKRDALKRSLEHQRCKSLKLHVLKLSKNIDYLKDQMNFSYYNQGMDDLGVSSRTLQQKNEEVPEVSPKCSKQEVKECASIETDGAVNFTRSEVPLDDMQNQSCFNEPKDDSSVTANPCPTGSSSAVSLSGLIRHQNQHSSTVTTSSDGHSKGIKDVDEPNLDVESAAHLPIRARPLSNQERLVLRKQALKMKKRPVLSIGRNNVITGVAKTIKTHFKKHPLAIVNIKNRADGTPIQQLISELEEATGSVLVSREINTVILYRGWGAEVGQKGSTENSMDVDEKEVISPQLLEAIKLECGLLPGESE